MTTHLKTLGLSYFNCTIQELKPLSIQDLHPTGMNFNCTIQELKRDDGKATAKAFAFQLHHTGIKTGF